LLTNICTHGCNNFSRLVTALHSKSESVSFIVFTANLSWNLVSFLQSLILHFCPYRCWGRSASNRSIFRASLRKFGQKPSHPKRSAGSYNYDDIRTVVPKLAVNYPPGVICDSLGGNTEPKPQFCSIL